MDERVKRIKTPEKCEIFAKNATDRGRPDLALEAKHHALALRAQEFGAESEAENMALQAIYAYEEVLSKNNGKKTKASKTWQMIKKYGIIPTVDRVVNRTDESRAYTALIELGLEDFAFEAVILKYPKSFSSNALAKSKERMNEWKSPK